MRRRDELGIERIGVVIRPHARAGAEERFRARSWRSECFSTSSPEGLARHRDGARGESRASRARHWAPRRDEFLARVTHVVHAAASVKFDLPVAEAARANITASLNMLELARTLPTLERFVYVSTAYVTPDATASRSTRRSSRCRGRRRSCTTRASIGSMTEADAARAHRASEQLHDHQVASPSTCWSSVAATCRSRSCGRASSRRRARLRSPAGSTARRATRRS